MPPPGTDDDKPKPVPSRDLTMQVDAVELSDYVADDPEPDEGLGAEDGLPEGALEQPPIVSVPPPLPPKRRGRGVYVALVVVALVMAGLGVGAGLLLFGSRQAPVAPAPPAAQPNVVHIGEFVIGPEAPAPTPAPAPPGTH